ncbi:NAD(P)-binding protein [Schizophyllum commune H4-8]|uniref:NAD(P)-binding protein n=1 Tax=Schizophyllum commune (strain H4-8 / FGSC 9210) TaxID=578458 RepID=UPI00215EDF7A|nr:NAD(P)-binding protein [Schizophyllum commune H4-8]KAI5894502.1 NAD(P)-binding protein [Schizophyllum commune H4-8]
MSSTQTKPLVVIFGATGETGQSIINGLLRTNAFRVAAVTRSLFKPAVAELAAKGVALHKFDLLAAEQGRLDESAWQARLQDILTGADTVIAVVHPSCIEVQRKIADAAKAVGVKRFVPNDFGTSAPAGVQGLHDRKLAIREYIRQIGLGHTFIEVAWWMQFAVIYPVHYTGIDSSMSRHVIGEGKTRFAVTDLFHIGDYVAHVIRDDRTLNQTVFIWEDEITQQQAWELAVKKLGEDILKTKIEHPEADFLKALDAARAAGSEQIVQRYVHEYWYSMHIRGDNVVEKAKALGALDFKELYPNVQTPSFKEFVKGVYASENPYVPHGDAYE